jgi:hypothetical protein
MQTERVFKELAEVNNGPNPVIPLSVVEQKRKAMDAGSPDAGLTSGGQPAMEDWLATLPVRIKAIAKVSDAVALLDEIRLRLQSFSGSGSRNSVTDLNQLQSDLRTLAEFIEACDHGKFNFAMLRMAQPNGGHRWRDEVSEARVRLARQAIATQLQEPEIQRAPLDVAALEKTISQHADDAAKQHDWLKTYKILMICARDNRFGRNQIAEEIDGITDYFAAQRLEKAEQWPEAIRTYQNILRRMGDRLPVAEATERLRAIKKEHPEAVAATPAQPTAPVP